MKTTVSVTSDDLVAGDRGNPYRCPVAWAVRRCIGCRDVYVGRTAVTVYRWPAGHVVVDLPPHVSVAINQFDGGFPVEPFSFELELP